MNNPEPSQSTKLRDGFYYVLLGLTLTILSPDQPWHKNNGGTLIKIGNIRIDVGSNTLLHMHLPGVFSRVHLPIGTIGAGIYGGVKR